MLSLNNIKSRRERLNIIVQENIKRAKQRNQKKLIDCNFLVISKPIYKECSICLEKIIKDNMKTKCNHYFHNDCINSWKNIGKNSCPNCRTHI
jgi:SUMO ligase MMS21 Smc5/6 complex component